MTPARARRLARIARAQRALADLAARDHQRAAEAHAESEAAAGAILAALNDDSPLHGLLTGMMADALNRNAITTYRLGREKAVAGAWNGANACAPTPSSGAQATRSAVSARWRRAGRSRFSSARPSPPSAERGPADAHPTAGKPAASHPAYLPGRGMSAASCNTSLSRIPDVRNLSPRPLD